MNCREVFETGLLYHHYANTAYPLTPHSFMQYRLNNRDEIYDFVVSEWQKTDALSLYIHVPFCKQRCKFCEYVVLEHTDDNIEDEYVDLLLKEMQMYAEILKGKRIVGYDLGGGTPAKLSVRNLKRITGAVNTLFNIEPDTVFSVETTPVIAANEPEKIQALYDLGYRRISMGVQTVSEKLLSALGREGSASVYEKAVANIRKAGFQSFNIDLMYGFLYQTDADFGNTLRYAVGLAPEHITLYRNRYKGTKIESEAGGVSIYKAVYQYRLAYSILTDSGYIANVGKNTFSRVPDDYGTSDYLTKRVIYGTPYVGMGLGAQSFGMDYLAYNLGAAEKRMERYRTAIREGRLPIQDIYRLPKEESIAKMVSVAFYFAFVDLAAFKARFGLDFCEYFRDEVDFVLQNKLMELKDGRLYLTPRGADNINGVIPLFYSPRSKEELKTAFAAKSLGEENDERLFLDAYNIDNYFRPSLAVDIAVFAQQPDAKQILLIRRGDHPYMNHWALPGGFLRSDETLEQAAARELREETGVQNVRLLPVGNYSDVARDPRGRIISAAYTATVDPAEVHVLSGDDAIDAKWFALEVTQDGGIYMLTLRNDAKTLTATLQITPEGTEILANDGLAFDHAKIILDAYRVSAV